MSPITSFILALLVISSISSLSLSARPGSDGPYSAELKRSKGPSPGGSNNNDGGFGGFFGPGSGFNIPGFGGGTIGGGYGSGVDVVCESFSDELPVLSSLPEFAQHF
ncbi:hypothetical protein TIFTF001_020037 [Ficus carica]|uniref:Glycine-rich protein n=1 Tax=Ficus carica TaxID=3494 RepID=A0AA88A9Z4_FICCA|nr:hypothetical protein TIFTF001_020037 [Ficus carica]